MRAIVCLHARARARGTCARGTHVLKYAKMDITAREIARVVIGRQHIFQKYLFVCVRQIPTVCGI